MSKVQAIFLDLILTGAGVAPQIPNPATLVYGNAGFDPEIHLMVGQNAYNVEDNAVYKRTKTGITKIGWLSDAERARIMTAAERTKLAGIQENANYFTYSHPSTHSADMITESSTKKVMTAAERTKLDGIAENANNYTHPSTHSADIITESSTKKVMTAAERTKLAGIAENANYINPDSIISVSSVDWITGDPKPVVANILSGELVEGEKHLIITTVSGNIIIIKNKRTYYHAPILPGPFSMKTYNNSLFLYSSPARIDIIKHEKYNSNVVSGISGTLGGGLWFFGDTMYLKSSIGLYIINLINFDIEYLHAHITNCIVSPTGKIYNNAANKISKYNLDGSLDSTYNSSVLGRFVEYVDSIDRVYYRESGNEQNHARLLSDGTLDSSFSITGYANFLGESNYTDKILFGGAYGTITRRNENGTVDGTFNSIAGSVSWPLVKYKIVDNIIICCFISANDLKLNIYDFNGNYIKEVSYIIGGSDDLVGISLDADDSKIYLITNGNLYRFWHDGTPVQNNEDVGDYYLNLMRALMPIIPPELTPTKQTLDEINRLKSLINP
jgi:hypothetical protein